MEVEFTIGQLTRSAAQIADGQFLKPMQKACGAPIVMTTARFRQVADAVTVVEAAEDIAIKDVVPIVAPAESVMAADLVTVASCPAADVVAQTLAAEAAAATVISVAITVASAGLPEQVARVDAVDSQIVLAMAHSSIAIEAVVAGAAVRFRAVIQDAALDPDSEIISDLVHFKTAAAAMAAC